MPVHRKIRWYFRAGTIKCQIISEDVYYGSLLIKDTKATKWERTVIWSKNNDPALELLSYHCIACTTIKAMRETVMSIWRIPKDQLY